MNFLMGPSTKWKEINISNSEVVNLDIINSIIPHGSTNSCTAGGIGHTLSSSWGDNQTIIKMDNCSFEHLNIQGPSGCVGGAIAFTNNGNTNLNDINVIECNMKIKESCSNNNIGGIFAHPQGSNNLTITNSNLCETSNFATLVC